MSKYDLVGVDGNAFSVMGYVVNAMRQCGMSKEERDKYKKAAMSSDYDHLICVSCDMIERCNDIAGWEDEDEEEEDYE